ncbi:unnamed protein product [Oppiella nova]|uniref:t-SNARE coiled-coil homology domain-containing protein n=1 Tax=Oppiella nova TaxID=334625 RepID=A0A7R9QW83_9ACAR|nr:unnamed protein product [Oppiella nova]CAG2177882.1 unnamed protein product [Oppiella nova]
MSLTLEIIDDIGDTMDQTNDRLLRNTRNIQKVNRKAGTCGVSTIPNHCFTNTSWARYMLIS